MGAPLRVVVVACLLLAARPATADEVDEQWIAATDKIATGADREAVDLLRQLSQNYPDAALADDALFLAASTLEEKLAEPVLAKELYEQLIERYPSSRSALAAKRRLAALELGLGEDGQGALPLARFHELLAGYPERSPQASQDMAKSILDEFPDWPENHRVRLWLAETARRQGQLKAALAYYGEVERSNAPSKATMSALTGAAEVHILRADFKAAKHSLDTLSARPSLSRAKQQSLADLYKKLKAAQQRSRLVTGATLLLGAMLAALIALLRIASGSTRQLLRELCSPPIEVFYAAPFAILLTAMALTGHVEIGPAVAIITGGGIVVTWLSALGLRARQARAGLNIPWVVASASAALIAGLALCYLALYRSRLIDLILTTVRFGPE